MGSICQIGVTQNHVQIVGKNQVIQCLNAMLVDRLDASLV